MWPLILRLLRTNAPYLTLPFAAIVGIVGYNLESWLSDKYTPYSSKYDKIYNYRNFRTLWFGAG